MLETLRSPVVFFGALLVGAIIVGACGSTTTIIKEGPDGSTGTIGGDSGAAVDTDAGTADSGSGPVDNGAPSSTYPAPHPAAPQVQTFGEATLANPKLIPIFFPNDDLEPQLTDFVNTYGATSAFSAAVTEYGVGPAVGVTPIDIPTAPATSIDDSAIQSFLAAQITAAAPGFANPDPDTIFMFYYPSTTTITLQGSTSCDSFGGYHDAVMVNGNAVSYAVMPRCSGFGGSSVLDTTTDASSHEIIEAVTDPNPNSNSPGYVTTDDAHAFWSFFLGGGEVGDMCAQFPDSFFQPAGFAYNVQRTWSNKAAAAGKDPCVPELPGEVYFNSAVSLPDSVSLGQGFTTTGAVIPVGQSKTLEVDLFSEAATTGPWAVQAQDASEFQGGKGVLDFSWDRTTGVNGEKLHLTVKMTAAPQQDGIEGFIIVSSLGQAQHMWLGMASTSAN